MAHTKHIWRAGLIVAFLATGGAVARHFVIPASFGKAGFYRYDSLKDYMAKPVVHGGSASCQPCHQKQFKDKSLGKHGNLSCEVCHAPVSVHVKGNTKIAPMPINRSPKLCLGCHQRLRARPKTQPQIDLREHLTKEMGMAPGKDIPDGVCITCHDPHNPLGDTGPAASDHSGGTNPPAAANQPAAKDQATATKGAKG